jgi:gamma-tubulin complex component 2
MTACTLFATYTSYLSRMLFTADPDLAGTAVAEAYLLAQSTPKHPISPSAAAFDPTRLEKMDDILQKYEENFTRHLRILVDALNYFAATETVALLGLCARLSMATDGMATGEVGDLVGNAGL